ncbi:flagellin [Methylococcus sp. EFPC2]|uniref:flagellin N-terminal helical domain-containing protein n=1 Tax=Methylococcus sp. EFPC2 TaxID=2812648 RepID=UPI0019682DBA|nr:flagellin [Methylococcus sp. EFPC2]QSA95857.1 flagellin [Methylococcus sp. EFPC2]
MAQVINTNIASINAQRNLYKSSMGQQTAMQRLSSGLRINSAKDDAAGLAIADRMTSQIRGVTQAARNANDGISVSQVAEGALGEITNSLQRMRELSVQAANDTNTASDRASIQKEVSQLQAEINRVVEQTQFNGKNVIDGTFTNQQFQVGAYANQTISVSIGSAKGTQIGSNTANSTAHVGGLLTAAADVSGGNNVVAQALTVSGPSGSATIPNTTITAGSTAKGIADAVNNVSPSTGVTASATTTATIASLGSAGTVSFTLYGESSAAISVAVASNTDLGSLASAINDKTGATGITAALSADKASITLTQSSGYDIKIQDFNNTGATKTVSVAGTTLTGGAGTDSLVVGGQVEFSGPSAFSVTSDDATNTVLGAASVSSSLSSVSSISVGTQSGANSALKIIDGALQFIDDLRATLGAVTNRFSSAISSLQSTSENVSAARSRIQDADFAAETAELSRTQILQQAGTAMLSQANASLQNVLSLLK